jgi:hypothetical protein
MQMAAMELPVALCRNFRKSQMRQAKAGRPRSPQSAADLPVKYPAKFSAYEAENGPLLASSLAAVALTT